MTTLIQKRPVVRAPFRLLAAIVCMAFVVAILGMGYMVWRGDRALRVDDVAWLPGSLWLMRLMFYAAVHGTVPTKDGAA
jgi:hypothetical protein